MKTPYRIKLSTCKLLAKRGLTRKNIRTKNFQNFSFDGAIFDGASFYGASFYRAIFDGASFDGASFYGASFYGASFYRAIFDGASFDHASFDRAIFDGASFNGASFGIGVILTLYRSNSSILRLRKKGKIIGYKKCRKGIIVKLKILRTSKRSQANSNKHRAERAEVLRIYGAEEGVSSHDDRTIYRVGETVQCHKWEPNRNIECGGGIHFYLTYHEALKH